MTEIKKSLPILGSGISLIDTHCHLDMDTYLGDLDDILFRAKSNKISHIISIGINRDSSIKAVKIAQSHSPVYASVGIHPHDAGIIGVSDLDELCTIIDGDDGSIVGYGEIGLDFVKQYAGPEIQKKIFRDQLALSKSFRLPVIIHDREAHEDILKILQEFGPFDNGGIMHCFSGDMEYAKKILDIGFHISIPGIVTFKNAAVLRDVAKNFPLSKLLVETDGPFLTPVPYRGKRNEPAYLLYTAAEIAKLRDISIDELAAATTANAARLFHLPHLC